MGVGVINAAATGMGLLSNQGPQPWHPASDDIKALCRRASDYCKVRVNYYNVLRAIVFNI